MKSKVVVHDPSPSLSLSASNASSNEEEKGPAFSEGDEDVFTLLNAQQEKSHQEILLDFITRQRGINLTHPR